MGAQHAVDAYRAAPSGIGARPSMSRKGDLFGNAPVESFFKTLRAELLDAADHATHAEARHDVLALFEAWCNRRRPHSAIGYVTPERMEQTAA